MINCNRFVLGQIQQTDRRVARRVAAVSFAPKDRQFKRSELFVDGTDLCSRGLEPGLSRTGRSI
jgi:hypothetical protein